MKGSESNDAIEMREGRVATRSNRHGGMLGGISSGMPIVLRCAVKPTSSIPREQETVTRGRADHDRGSRTPRPLPPSSIRADGGSDDGAYHARRPRAPPRSGK
jgi:chorismate synthase